MRSLHIRFLFVLELMWSQPVLYAAAATCLMCPFWPGFRAKFGQNRHAATGVAAGWDPTPRGGGGWSTDLKMVAWDNGFCGRQRHQFCFSLMAWGGFRMCLYSECSVFSGDFKYAKDMLFDNFRAPTAPKAKATAPPALPVFIPSLLSVPSTGSSSSSSSTASSSTSASSRTRASATTSATSGTNDYVLLEPRSDAPTAPPVTRLQAPQPKKRTWPKSAGKRSHDKWHDDSNA